MAWVQQPDGRKRCERHDTVFSPGIETCAGCDSSPEIFRPAVVEDSVEHEDDKNLEILASEALQRAKVCHRAALERVDGTDKEFRDALLAMVQADKSARLFAEIIGPRKAKRQSEWLRNENRKLNAGGRGN